VSHSTKSASRRAFENDVEALSMVRRLVITAPNNRENRRCVRLPTAPTGSTTRSTRSSRQPNKAYDIKELIFKVVDDTDFLELQPDYAKNMVIGFGA